MYDKGLGAVVVGAGGSADLIDLLSRLDLANPRVIKSLGLTDGAEFASWVITRADEQGLGVSSLDQLALPRVFHLSRSPCRDRIELGLRRPGLVDVPVTSSGPAAVDVVHLSDGSLARRAVTPEGMHLGPALGSGVPASPKRGSPPTAEDSALARKAIRGILALEKEAQTSLRNAASLQEIENARKTVWVKRLMKIMHRAEHEYESRSDKLPILDQIMAATSTIEEGYELVRISLSTGAWRTIRGHVYNFLRFEYFVRTMGTRDDSVYPVRSASVVKYLMYLRGRGIKPSVPGAIRSSCIWVSKRLMMPIENLETNPFIGAIAATICEVKSINMTEKKVLRVDHVIKLEEFMKVGSRIEILYMGAFLIMIMASLRFDDLLHTAPELVTMLPGAILGVSWQTKVDRTRRGTKWAGSRGSFTGFDWVKEWMEVYKSVLYPRDYFLDIPNEDMTDVVRGVPFEYPTAVKIYEKLFAKAGIPAQEILAGIHHLRAFFVTLGAHTGASSSELKLMGNWRTETMAQVYTAHAREIPLALCRRLIGEIRNGWRPQYEGADSARSGGAVIAAVGLSQVSASSAADGAPGLEAEVRFAALRNKALADDVVMGTSPGSIVAPTVLGPDPKLVALEPDLDRLTSSEPSDGEVEAGDVVLLYRKSSDYRNCLHIQNELIPSVTACVKQHIIFDMTAVSVTEEQILSRSKSRKSGLCVACVAARPDRFPEEVVQDLQKKFLTPPLV